jgi:hypothetical protein
MELLERMLGRHENAGLSPLESEQNGDSDTNNGSFGTSQETQLSAVNSSNSQSQFEAQVQQPAPSTAHEDAANESLSLELDTHTNTSDAYNTMSPFNTPTQEATPTTSRGEPSQLQQHDNQPSWEHQQAPPSPPLSEVSRSKGLVDCLLSTEGHLSYCKRNGQTRYYAPTTNIHVYSDLTSESAPPVEWEQKKRVARVLDNISPKIHDYLMELYWTYHNPVSHVVHKEFFYRHMENIGSQYYSGVLHICILAMGFRFADTMKPEIQQMTLSKRESTLHREARYLFEYELEKKGDLAELQALLILGDLECSVGRDNAGSMYAGQ